MIHLLKKNALYIQVLVFSIALLALPVQAQQQNANIEPNTTYIGDLVVPAGTVRVNNLANLENLLNTIGNSSEVVGFIFGFLFILRSLLNGRSPLVIPILKWNLSRRSQFLIGCGIILIGLAIPGIINSLVASARDVEIFN